ncbi:MAG: hypothetical protein HY901_01430 [Deltaproteobacteria bacterium]|nr:hypothetical protein [Deltaproteobacteria bacterium]
MAQQFDYNAIFANDITALKASVETHNEVLNVMDWAIASALEELESNGHLSQQESLLQEYREAIKILRKRGFKRPRVGQEGIPCPACKAMLKDITGEVGDRCGWCGYEFK